MVNCLNSIILKVLEGQAKNVLGHKDTQLMTKERSFWFLQIVL